MEQVVPLLRTQSGPLARVAIFLSGSGSNAEKILLRVHDSTGEVPFEAAVLVTDAPETSRGRELSQTYSVPLIENDIRQFYRDRGESRVSIATPAGRRVREAWTDALRAQLTPYAIDFGVFAGFVPLTNLTADFPCLNVHPGDLTYLKDGSRYLVGLHTVPIERAILEELEFLRSSVIVAEPYTGRGDDMDSGPILGVSPRVPVDLAGSTLAELKACLRRRPRKRPRGGYGDQLEETAVLNQENLKQAGDWIVLPEVVFDFARQRFGTDARGQLHYLLQRKWHPIETVTYGAREREILFA